MRLEYFQMVDRIISLDIGSGRIAAECQVPDASPVFEGHFPGYPILPGALMIETMAQAGGWLVLAIHRFDRMAFLMRVEKAKIRATVAPGTPLSAAAQLVHDGSGYAVIRGTLAAAGRKVAEAEIRYGISAFPNDTLKAAIRATARRVAIPGALLDAPASTASPPAPALLTPALSRISGIPPHPPATLLIKALSWISGPSTRHRPRLPHAV
jgi:3-hydroxyacyl-[acyl-carrier-protein] dehydratase